MNSSTTKSAVAFHQWLDLFRWCAAMLVLYTHTMNRFLVPLSEATGKRSAFYYAASFMTGFSHQAVMIFFVLSGFLVGGALVKEYRKNGTVDIRMYVVKRLARLWTVLLPALILSFAMNGAAFHFFAPQAEGVYPTNLEDQSDLVSFVCTMVFFHTVACQTFAANGPLWSIFNEFWYYMVWPLLFPILFTRGSIWQSAALALSGILILLSLTYWQFTGSWLAPYMLIWLLGVAAAVIPNPPVRSPGVIGVALALFLLGTRLAVRRTFWEDYPYSELTFDIVLGVLFALLLSAMKECHRLRAPIGGSIHESLAGFSFSLYCIHAPILTFYGVAVAAMWNMHGPIKPVSAVHWLFLLTPVILMIPLAFVFSLGTEQKTHKVRQLLDRIIPKHSSMRGGARNDTITLES
ncbi:acyltransferase family protein [Novosphingobium fluoreni]|nr:acyltransferase [Novosphingobium fluoreni]